MVMIFCKYCDKQYYSSQSNRNRHRREVHDIKDTNIPEHYEERYLFRSLEGCDVSFRFNFKLRLHLQSKHNIDTMEKSIVFETKVGIYPTYFITCWAPLWLFTFYFSLITVFFLISLLY